jgi:hypothetical protein
MIGIIETDLKAFSIIEIIKKKYPKVNIKIYSLDNNIEKGIIKLQDTCKIIVIPSQDDIKQLENKYPNISFLSVKPLIKENSYILDDTNIIELIHNGNEKEIREVLKQLVIPKDKTIIINNPELLWIQSIIKEVLPNPIINTFDSFIEELEEIINNNHILINQEGIVSKII